jgi:hypothetical protein
MKVFVVVTVKHIPNESCVFADPLDSPEAYHSGCSFFGDIILITKDEKKAETTTQLVKERRPYLSLDYATLAAFDDVIYFPREMEEIIKNDGEVDE